MTSETIVPRQEEKELSLAEFLERGPSKPLYLDIKKLDEPKGSKQKNFLRHLFSRVQHTDKIYFGNEKTTVDNWRELLIQNQPPNRKMLRMFAIRDNTRGNSLQGPCLGSFCERRFAALATLLADLGLIEGVSLLSDTREPLFLKEQVPEEMMRLRLEEVMGIDCILRINNEEGLYEYIPVQIKSSKRDLDYDKKLRRLYLSEEEKNKLVQSNPLLSDELFGFDESKRGKRKYILHFQRNIFTIAVSKRKLVKTCQSDQKDDLANVVLAYIEYGKEHGRTLKLGQPYPELSYPERVSVLIEQEFLKPVSLEEYQGIRVCAKAQCEGQGAVA